MFKLGAALLTCAGGASPEFSDKVVRVEAESDEVDLLELSLLLVVWPFTLGMFFSWESQCYIP